MPADDFESTARELRNAFVAAYPLYVAGRLGVLGFEVPPEMAAAIEAGQEQLRADLGELLARPVADQDRSPLEVFQSALQAPTAALAAAGIDPVDRDPVAMNALPGDLYDLAPASSQALGEAAFHAHLAWGVSKAAAVAGMVPATSGSVDGGTTTRPAVVLVGSDVTDRAFFADAVSARGLGLVLWRNPGAIERGLASVTPAVAFVDLAHGAADDAIRVLAAADVRTVGFGLGVNDFAMARYGLLGADEVVERSRLFGRLGDYLPRQA
jgi:hypothetical protein